LLWRLYHITNEINESAQKVEEANVKLRDLRAAVVSGFRQSVADPRNRKTRPTVMLGKRRLWQDSR
jgi:structural maintenance of chromosome 1